MTTPSAFRVEKRNQPLPPVEPDPVAAWKQASGGARVQWLGHASVLVEIDGTRVLIDPVFGRAGVVKRLVAAPVSVDGLPHVDAVLITHGHYDHLCTRSLRALSLRFGPDLVYVVPQGVKRCLPARCLAGAVELSWWEQVRVGHLRCSLVPAQHWHRRGPFDLDRALWGGFVVEGSASLYHSGDTGYFGGFEAIGAVFPNLDIAVLPLGAYEPRWFMSPQHMAPEDTVRAWSELGARRMLGMHWGTFDLTDEPSGQGAFQLLPRALAAQGKDPEHAVVLPHGGALRF
jgi:L-ascorbate metabolism protein UlaG (beta-lactamase superfamily)